MASRFSFRSRSACLAAGFSIVAALLVACTSSSADDHRIGKVSTWWLRDAGAQRILPVIGGPLLKNRISAAASGLPQRPAADVIVERGGPPNKDHSIFVHGTHGDNRLVIGWESYGRMGHYSLTVRSLKGERLTSGTGCRYDEGERLVRCDDALIEGEHGSPEEQEIKSIQNIYVHLWGGDDVVLAEAPAVGGRLKFEMWGEQGNDRLEVERRDYYEGDRRYASPLRGTYQWLPTAPVLLGGDGNDTLIGSEFAEALWGGPGDDFIQPGGGQDNIDGGHGEFNSDGPSVRTYMRDDAFCADRTHGFWDRRDDHGGGEGVDTLDLTNIHGGGMLVDLNICRASGFDVPEKSAARVLAMEIVHGTNQNDRIVGDDTGTTVIGNKGEDWLYSGVNGGTADARDGARDTVKCVGGPGQRNLVDDQDQMLQAEAGTLCSSWERG